jgi:hypothetical protein
MPQLDGITYIILGISSKAVKNNPGDGGLYNG